jgi:hypothetical protein
MKARVISSCFTAARAAGLISESAAKPETALHVTKIRMQVVLPIACE